MMARRKRTGVPVRRTPSDVHRALVDRLPRKPVRVLDAGCGEASCLPLPCGVHVVGIDRSAAALARNEHLDEAILGDLEIDRLPEATFDVVICWNVLEHLRRPERALENLSEALRTGGLLVLGLPNLLAPKALATKLTPYRFHRWIYRRVLGNRNAGRDGHPPFPTHLRWMLRPQPLQRALEKHSLELDYIEFYEEVMLRKVLARSRVLGYAWRVAGAPFWLLGSDPNLTDIALIFRKTSADPVLE
jgi:SAM-dependent methyltransferase